MASNDSWERGTVCFEARDGIYWLRGPDLRIAESALGLAYDCDAVGFDRETVRIHVVTLLKKRFSVTFRSGATLRSLSLARIKKAPQLRATPLWLSSQALLGTRELARLQLCALKRPALRDQIGLMKAALNDAIEVATVYVYLAGADWYEVDWKLSSISEKRLQAFALAAHETGRKLPCRLVPPKPKRSRASIGSPSLLVSEPVTYGQLRLTI